MNIHIVSRDIGGLRASQRFGFKASGQRMRTIDALTHRRTEERRKIAQACASRIVQEAAARGVDISVIGSLANGRFRSHSDLDLLVHGHTDSPRRGEIERMIADTVRGTGIPYDLIFASDISSQTVRELLNDGV